MRRAMVGISLLVCILSLALMLRSLRTTDHFVWNRTADRATLGEYDGYEPIAKLLIRTEKGGLLFVRSIDAAKTGGEEYLYGPGWHYISSPAIEYPTIEVFVGGKGMRALGFEYGSRRWNARHRIVRIQCVTLPLWVLVLASALLPTYQLRTWRRARLRRWRLVHALCVECGYDLRVSGDRCPECGAAAQRSRQDSNLRPVD